MNTETPEPTKPERTQAEQRADQMCDALDHIIPDGANEIIWSYFHDGKDALAFMYLQTAALHGIEGYLEEIEMSISRLPDEDGDLSVYIQNPS